MLQGLRDFYKIVAVIDFVMESREFKKIVL